ncbi:antibiotic biosynthesis monooxygenase [Rathayibacter sp. VKM Ac-2759]|uniref:antibiotic biosynthesis monooxygenase n=1 Tax=Rathayibacter sp. VKM Ac-2759 TaxID=2609252 RepID=UPI001ABE7063|nr:antibiotic biosynthesis monooxygenase [Rathayibacter sp. VKM Ac-2759]
MAETTTSAPVSLVVHRRLAEADYARYEAWQDEVGARLEGRDGFLGRESIRPDPPHQVDWIVIERFRDRDAARSWMQSPERAALLARIDGLFVGNDAVHLVTEEAKHPAEAASVLITTRVAPEDEGAFLAWQRRISAAESHFEGFAGHRVERPIPGLQEDWVVVLSFATEADLNRWIDSPERRALLADGAAFNQQLSLTRASYGFGFWAGRDKPVPDPVFKSNLLVLLMLYPIVFLWSYFIADPLFASHGVPFWLSLFIGNVVSTQLLGWIFVPWAFRLFSWWTERGSSRRVQVAGYAIIVGCYLLSMAVYAGLLALRAG